VSSKWLTWTPAKPAAKAEQSPIWENAPRTALPIPDESTLLSGFGSAPSGTSSKVGHKSPVLSGIGSAFPRTSSKIGRRGGPKATPPILENSLRTTPPIPDTSTLPAIPLDVPCRCGKGPPHYRHLDGSGPGSGMGPRIWRKAQPIKMTEELKQLVIEVNQRGE
jgi:hypothetical protein